MTLKHRLADASYWVYDRMRHKSAFDSAAQPGTAPDFAGFREHKYALLVTFRRDGTAVPTPVWFALLDDRRFVTHTEERTAKFLESVGSELSGEMRVHLAQVNGEPGVVITAGGEPISALVLDVSEGVAQTIHLVANPEKLAGVRAVEAP